MSIVGDECIYFRSCPHLCRELLLNVWDWGGGRTLWVFVLFCFLKVSKLRIKKTQTYPLTMICEVVFFCGNFFFFNSIKGLWRLLSSQLHLTVCRVLGFFFLVFLLNDCTPGKLNSKPLCVFVCVCRCRQDGVDLPAQTGGYCIS